MGGSEDDQLMKRRICKMPKRYFALKARVMDVRWNSYDIWLELIEDKRFNGRKVTAKLNLYHRYNCHSCRFGDVIAYKVSISRPKSLRCRKQAMARRLTNEKGEWAKTHTLDLEDICLRRGPCTVEPALQKMQTKITYPSGNWYVPNALIIMGT